MKKGLLSIIALLVITTMVNAAPRFGAAAGDNGVGGFITDDMYNASLTYSSSDEDTSTIGLSANYKVALDSVTALTAGIGYSTQDADGTETTTTSINLGIERALSSNILLNLSTPVYSTEDADGDETVSMFEGANVSVAYLF